MTQRDIVEVVSSEGLILFLGLVINSFNSTVIVVVVGGEEQEVEESVGIRGLLERGESTIRLGLRPDTSIL